MPPWAVKVGSMGEGGGDSRKEGERPPPDRIHSQRLRDFAEAIYIYKNRHFGHIGRSKCSFYLDKTTLLQV